MPETASPDNDVPIADPQAHETSTDFNSLHKDDVIPVDLEAVDVSYEAGTSVQASADAPALINGHGGNHEGDGRPAKRRRTLNSTPPPLPSSLKKPKPISPPWKKIGAEGPTSFTENGRRKSGRINTLPLELQPQGKKRLTRHSLGSKSSATQAKKADTTPVRPPNNKVSSQKKRVGTPKSTLKRPEPPTSRASSRSLRRRTPSPPAHPTRKSTRTRRSSRAANVSDAEGEVSTPAYDPPCHFHDGSGRSPRIKLLVGRAGFIPLVHADQVRKRPKIGASFEDFWARAGAIPVEDGGLFASEDGPIYTDEAAARDARLIARIEEEVQGDGILSLGRCSAFIPEEEEEPTRQYARQDHIIKAMANFRKLLLLEQQRHRAIAKKLAEACRDAWISRQPKSAEQLEAEARQKWIVHYRNVVRAMLGTWENVRAQVNRRRLEQWEAEEQKRVKAALNEAVNLSEQKLQARRGLDSEQISDDDDGFDGLSDDPSTMDDDGINESNLASDSDGDEEDLDSNNMSTSEEEEEGVDGINKDVGDEGLTQEQLRAKYANLPDLKLPEKQTSTVAAASDALTDVTDVDSETSDESVDMDDDLGSSDMASDDGDNGGDEDDSSHEEGDEDAGGLLSLLFGESDLKQMRQAATKQRSDDTDSTAASFGLGHDEVEGDNFSLKQELDENVSPVSPPIADAKPLLNVHDPPGESLKEGYANGEPSTVVSKVREGPKIKYSDPKTAGGVVVPQSLSPKEDATMSDTQAEHSVQPHGTPLISNLDKPTSPETEPVTTPTSPRRSQSPPTSDTRPSEVDASSAELGLANQPGRRSTTPHTPSPHKTEIPFLLRGTLREYQHDGLDWLAGLYANNTNGILADEMGLGKTIQTIALLAHLACYHEIWGPHLVVVPTSVMLNWEMEFKKWCPGFKILAYYGSQDERKRKRQGWNNDDVWNVCITSYQLVLQDQQVFKRRRWHYLVLDEAHNIKNFKSQRWQTLLGFNTQARLLLTGTPLQNNLTELWSLLFFLMPAENGVGGFADLQEFQDWFRKPESQILESGRDQMDEEARAIISKLHKVLRPYLLRRLKADVEKQMPAKYEHVEFCRLSKRQRELYDGFLSRSDTKETLSSGNYLSIINCLMQLRKVCNHPDLFIDRPIMTSFRMSKSVPAEYTTTERKIRSLLGNTPMSTVNLGFLNLVPTQHEHLASANADRIAQLSSHRALMDLREAQKARAQAAYTIIDPSTVGSSISYLESGARWGRFEELQHCVYLNALRRQQRPIYGKDVIDLVSINAYKRPCRPKPKIPQKIMSWFEGDLASVRALTPTLGQRTDTLKSTISKFSCVTPPIVTRDLEQVLLGHKAVQAFTDEDLRLSAPVRWAPFLPKEVPPDPWHESRMRHSIQFPDKRLLQYDCGKLQVLDKLLRKLQAGGHRALIFTQMTKVLDILEQFLNIHGHKYLRLDGATKVEQRQILTDRFNNDSRILCFILSTRSGGLGINLTGADTVIFYDQDWNPAMDKQCQDRCHRIGQTRDVHIYRLVSEHTIEANILRKASQKQMLDDVVIQEGEFTTDYFNKMSVREVLEDKVDFTSEGVAAADAALERVLGGPDTSRDQRTVGRALEQAEDREDIAAARVAEREIQADDADFTEKTIGPASGTSTARQGTPAGKSVMDGGLDLEEMAQIGKSEMQYNASGDVMGNIDQYMLKVMAEELKHTKLELPKDKKKSKKKGRDTRKR
ncbi:helicase SWR1 [Metarhizium album ARSEF 1941]|uniref:DNA helicase n=1 Tax=Metarhizium album (strain ARSEF 1941) TaxID=1081103 RepID=A0A0B2WR98_METAS|nr:helicase SWR1 [Metarhizium album ARSEF 1941]KHN96022.1 helicase SWR1 [Metarhizium album ARSEF 1941]